MAIDRAEHASATDDEALDALKLGIPFSDSLADGPTIQEANIRALNNGITPRDCFDIITKIRAKYPLLIFLLDYYFMQTQSMQTV